MPILSQDLKILKSSVMADTPDGGGPMAGNEVEDGVSNNMFPDTSSGDRAFGRVNIRSVFGVAQTPDADTLLGAHVMISEPPDDLLVHCTLMESPTWGATRDQYREGIERYLVRSSIIACQLYGAHYEGASTIRVFALNSAEIPEAGSVIVLQRPDESQEQYLRILRLSVTSQFIGFRAYTIAQVTLGQSLEFDFAGDEPTQGNEPQTRSGSKIYGTNVSAGAKFYGIKKLGVDASVGDFSVTTQDGIFTPLVPAATVESPLVDQYPLRNRVGLSNTGVRPISVVAACAVSAGVTLKTPTAIKPGSLSLSHGGAAFTDDGLGSLKQGATIVASIAYAEREIRFLGTSPNYGTTTNTITYTPATISGASTHSAAQDVTIVNQGLVYTYAFEPPPAPGTLTLSYMAQNRWYTLNDNGAGKLSGADTSYGVGTISYSSGSAGVTLGAIPDVGSALIWQWGRADSAKAYDGAEPAKIFASIDISRKARFDSILLEWSRDSTNYAAAVDANGVITGDATGKVFQAYAGFIDPVTRIEFAPNVFPSAGVTVSWSDLATLHTDAVSNGGGSYTLGRPPAIYSISLILQTIAKTGFEIPQSISVVDNGAGLLLSTTFGSIGRTVGTVNYTTGVVVLNNSVSMDVYEAVKYSNTVNGQAVVFERRELRAQHTVALIPAVSYINHAAGASTPGQTQVFGNLSYQMSLPVFQGVLLSTDGLAFTCGSDVYTSAGGVLRRGWNQATGAEVDLAGAVTSAGLVTVNSLPTNGVNTVSLSNAAVNLSSAMGVGNGVFRVAAAPLKTGVFQIQSGSLVGQANGSGVIFGGGFTGTIDFGRGIVRWSRISNFVNGVYDFVPTLADELSYNAVYLQFVPLDADTLGLDTARLPLDGKVPIFHAGALSVVHNTETFQLPNPLVKGTTYTLPRNRIASIRARAATGAIVPSSLYTQVLDVGEFVVPVGSDITAYPQPWSIEHTIEDMVLVSEADISGQIKFTRALSHEFPAANSYVSSALFAGDLFARVSNVFDQQSWTGAWSDERIGADTLASYNTIDQPLTITNEGAVTERWVLIFTSNTAFRFVGEKYGQVATGNINTLFEPINLATGAPFVSIKPQGWGSAWAQGNVLRLNTYACGKNFGVVRTILQGQDTLSSDKFTLAWRADVNA
jgi:hypothetical protein